MGDDADAHHREKEQRRKKQAKRMTKIVARAWGLDEETASFQEKKKKTEGVVLCLSDIGQKIDEQQYKLGRHGWEDFARDLGGVYNRHIRRKNKKAPLAQEHLNAVKEWLGAKDASLAKLASEHVPTMPTEGTTSPPPPSMSRKRSSLEGKAAENGREAKRGRTTSKNAELAEREERAMDHLAAMVEEKGGSATLVSGFRARVIKQRNGTKFDINFFNEPGRRFRSMIEVARFLNLVDDSATRNAVKAKAGLKKKATTSKSQDAAKKKLRREIERLRKSHVRAMKSLDEFASGDKETRYPVDDRVLLEEEAAKDGPLALAGRTSAAARIPDIDCFPGIPKHCVPDVLMSWDFLCTFQRGLYLTPISLDDFAKALAYVPQRQVGGDDVISPPVYLAEAHLSLLKLLVQDRSSDDWWWSTIETDVTEGNIGSIYGHAVEAEEKQDDTTPVIKVDTASLLAETEDPLITQSWLKSLEDVCKKDSVKTSAVKSSIKTALKVVSNKWVFAYLKKTLDCCKSKDTQFARGSVRWLVDLYSRSRPDLSSASVTEGAVLKARAQAVEECTKRMAMLPDSAPTVKEEEDVVSDAEYDDDDEDSDDSDDEDGMDDAPSKQTDSKDESERPASYIPPKPLPTLVDLLLPPAKPFHNAEFINAFSWSHLVGATAQRVLHRKKRLLNEMDDSIRHANQLPPMTLAERRPREEVAASRILTECHENDENGSIVERAIDHLCTGGCYLELDPQARLCLIRLLIEAAYDSGQIYLTVDGNYKQRLNAVKALDVEQRRAKREAKEKAAADERAAREKLSGEAKERFLDEKRDEIRALNEKTKDYPEEIIDSLTDEDILEFDDDIKADYEALPGPESYSKAVVNSMVERMREETAFETDALKILTMDELLEREKLNLEELEGQLLGFGGEGALDDPSFDRETARSIGRLQRDIDNCKTLAEKLPEQRQKALEQLKDAIEDGTIKVLRTAITAAKKAKLTGPDDETGGVWAVAAMRDAALELENAKQNKRVADAQKDLIAKMNKCFIRTEPVGLDRFENRFWRLDNDESGHIWAETEFAVKDSEQPSTKPPPGFLDLAMDGSSIAVGAPDMEDDFTGVHEKESIDSFRLFSRREHHSSGFTPTMAKSSWGCHATEETRRGIIKNLDSRGVRENDLKKKLQEALEDTAGNDEKPQEQAEAATQQNEEGEDNNERENAAGVLSSGDEDAFRQAKESVNETEESTVSIDDAMTSAIGATVRVRILISESRDGSVARYEGGKVNGWETRQESKPGVAPDEGVEEEFGEDGAAKPAPIVVDVPYWRVLTDRGHLLWLSGTDLLQSLSRYAKWENGKGYYEDDASFLAYRNHVGRYCGRAAEAPYASSPIAFASLMLKKEDALYTKLKVRNYDNTWGGKGGSRGLWMNSMKDYAYDFETVRRGLLTLEQAFFELTGEFADYVPPVPAELPDGKALLDDPVIRVDIELESIEKNVPGLWNSPASRAVFLEIVSTCSTTGFLALALDLLCRNAWRYVEAHNLNSRGAASARAGADDSYASSYGRPNTRTTRRAMNAWQQANQDWYED